MAKPKRPSMLSRQRQLRAQQQQVRRASRNNLPPTGGSSGGNGGAISPRGSSAPATRGGALTPSRRGPAVDQGVKPVRVRVMPPKPLGGGSVNPPTTGTPPRALPPGAAGGSLSRAPRGRVAGALAGIAAGRTLGNAIGGAYRRAVGTEKAQQFGREGGYGRYTPRGSQEGGGMGGVGNIPPAEGRMNNPNYGKPGEKPAPARASRPSSSRPSSSTPAKPAPSKPAAPAQSKNMDENYAAWAKSNKGLAAKVKPNQAGYSTIKATLDGLKIGNAKPKTSSEGSSQSSDRSNTFEKNRQSIDASKSQAFNADKLLPKGKKPDNTIAQYTSRDKADDKMLLKSIQRGDFGKVPQEQIDRLINRINGVRGA